MLQSPDGVDARVAEMIELVERQRARLDGEVHVVEAELRRRAREIDAIKRLQTIPAIGPLTATTIYARVGRFYLSFCPGRGISTSMRALLAGYRRVLGVVLLLVGMLVSPCWSEVVESGGHYASAREEWLNHGGAIEEPDESPPIALAGGRIVWDNGGSNQVNGLASERNATVSGTGGPEGDHGSTVADDFQIDSPTIVDEIRVCLYHNGTTAEMYIYQDAGGVPAAPVTAPLWGAPTTVDIVSTTFQDNTPRCQNAFGYTGRQYVFSQATTGVAITLAPGRYWLAVVGEGGSRGFWATSSPANPLNIGKWGSTFFGTLYWSDTTLKGPEFRSFAFYITDFATSTSVPALGGIGLLVVVVLLLALGGLSFRQVRRS
jgi:hypothetical protein